MESGRWRERDLGLQQARRHDGWLPLSSDTDWEINRIGRIKGDGRWYLIAVLTAHDPREQYGIDAIGGISPLVWRALRPRVSH